MFLFMLPDCILNLRTLTDKNTSRVILNSYQHTDELVELVGEIFTI